MLHLTDRLRRHEAADATPAGARPAHESGVFSVSAMPRRAHFIWLGERLHLAHVLALHSAVQNGGFAEVVLHHDEGLRASPFYDMLRAEARLTLEPIGDHIFAAVPQPGALRALYASLEQPAARANVLRVAILFARGGVYLDTDTVTVRPFAELCQQQDLFCGAEHVVYPSDVLSSGDRAAIAAAHVRSLVRSLLRTAPRGYRAFERVAHLYPLAVNNAVFGAKAGHWFLAELMEAMLAMNRTQSAVRFALGTHLLQQMVARHPDAVHVCPPEVFYPLGPELSTQWFKKGGADDLERIVRPNTVAIHWYASVKTDHILPQLDRDLLAQRSTGQLYMELVNRYMRPHAICGQVRQSQHCDASR